MKIIEQFVAGKRGEALCEDAIVVTDHFVAVLDGSTSKGSLKPRYSDKTPGQIAVGVVSQLIRDADPAFDLWTFCHHATEMLRMTHEKEYGPGCIPYLEQHPEDRFCCSAIIYSRFQEEVWMIGDCHGLIIDREYAYDKGTPMENPKPYEKRTARKRSNIIKKALTEGISIGKEPPRIYTEEELRRHDIGRDAIIPNLKRAMQKQNQQYAVLDGFPVALDKVRIFKGFCPGLDAIILASDGYPKLYRTLKLTENHLQRLLRKDPLCINENMATKAWMEGNDSFDDRAYIRFQT